MREEKSLYEKYKRILRDHDINNRKLQGIDDELRLKVFLEQIIESRRRIIYVKELLKKTLILYMLIQIVITSTL